jgi:L-asparaginase II
MARMTVTIERRDVTTQPILVEVTRGTMVESRHAGSVAVLDAKGKVRLSCGDIAQPIYPRSAIKPIQAMPLIETGAAETYKLSDVEIALACASHGGEPRHVAAVLTWLGRIGCTVDDLECGAHPPRRPSRSTAPTARSRSSTTTARASTQVS